MRPKSLAFKNRTLNYKGLVALLSAKRYVPRTEIAVFLTVNESYVTAVISRLRADGYLIENQRGVGYRIRDARMLGTLNPKRLGPKSRAKYQATQAA